MASLKVRAIKSSRFSPKFCSLQTCVNKEVRCCGTAGDWNVVLNGKADKCQQVGINRSGAFRIGKEYHRIKLACCHQRAQLLIAAMRISSSYLIVILRRRSLVIGLWPRQILSVMSLKIISALKIQISITCSCRLLPPASCWCGISWSINCGRLRTIDQITWLIKCPE